MANRVYIGRIPYRVHERDIERFFRGIGRIRDIMLKSGYCFVEFDSPRDVEDAIYECNGQTLCGERVTVEAARGTPHGEDLRRDAERGIDYPVRCRREFERPMRMRGDYKLLVENLSTRISWQELKEIMGKVGEVAFADAHRERRNEGIVEFVSRGGMERALDKFQGLELNGRRIKLIDVTPSSRKRSYSRSSSSSRARSEEEWRKKRRRRKSDSNRSDHTGSDVEDDTESETGRRRRDIENGYDKLLDEEDEKDRRNRHENGTSSGKERDD